MKIIQLIVGPLQSNCYVVFDDQTKKGIVIDPGDDGDEILKVIRQNDIVVSGIVCTHGHFDHIGALALVKSETGAPVLVHREELEIYNSAKDQGSFWGCEIAHPPAPDRFLEEGDQVEEGVLRFDVMHTPGHSPGCICLLGNGVIFTGDTIFAGSVGRTDFYGGNIDELKKSFRRILSLPDDVKILPGHGELSSVAREKEYNFFIHEL